MASERWTITKKKTASTSMAEGQARKRVRLSVTPSEAGQRQRQQTLTQAQWIPSRSPSFKDEIDLKPLKAPSGRTTSRTTLKRNSTLTQMDFFRDVPKQEDLDASLFTEIGAEAKAPQSESGDGNLSNAKSRDSPGQTVVSSTKGTHLSRGPHEEDCTPAKKRRRDIGATSVPERNVRRRSGRLVEREVKVSSTAIHVPSEQPDTRQIRVPEFQASVDTHEDEFQLALQSRPLPKTPPHAARKVVLSSQSPERECFSIDKSGRRSTARKAGQFEREECARSPLREKSVNLPLPPPRTCRKQREVIRRAQNACSRQSSKIVSLKLPKRSTHAHTTKVEDSQALWSLPVTSSSAELSGARSNSNNSPDPLLPSEEGETRQSDGPEIPSTSQIEEDRCLAEPVAMEADTTVERNQDENEQTEQVAEFLVGDEHGKTSKEASSDEAATPPVSSPAKQGEPDEQEQASDIDFDSPIANDTQFNAEVARQTTPPIEGISEDSLAIPTPRLVPSNSCQGSSCQVNEQQREQASKQDSSEDLLPPAPQAGTTTTITTTLVPLNDTLMAPPPPPPSSPLPPPQSNSHRSRLTTTTTQQSSVATEVRPASMPHLSQISTQEATQLGLLSSLPPTAESADVMVKKEPISIKEDSSSLGLLSLSQIPTAEGESQGLNAGLVEVEEGQDEEEEEEELDLDECLEGRRHQAGATAVKKGILDNGEDGNVTPRPGIKQTSQLDQNVVEQDGGLGVEAESQTLLSSPSPSPSASLTDSQDPDHDNQDHHDRERGHSPIPGFNNETQSNFTQGGHVTAAYIHRQRDLGILPKWYTPKPYRVPGYTRR